MALAAPARRLTTPVQEPLPVEPQEPKKRPRDRPRPGGQGRSSVTASTATAAPPKPKRKSTSPGRKAAPGRKKGSGGGKKTSAGDSPIRRTKASSRAAAATAAPARKATAAPARKAPARRKVAPKRRPAGVIPIAAGTAVRGAVAVTQLPESGLIHRLTRGRAWIGVLGVLLVGIVALNVVTLSFAASAGKVDARNQELSKENSVLQSRSASRSSQLRISHEASKLGLGADTSVEAKGLTATSGDVATAAARLAAAAAGVAATSEGGTAGEAAASGEAATGEEAVAGATGESEFTPEEEAIYNREYEELVASEGGETGISEEALPEESVTEIPAQ